MLFVATMTQCCLSDTEKVYCQSMHGVYIHIIKHVVAVCRRVRGNNINVVIKSCLYQPFKSKNTSKNTFTTAITSH